MPQERFSTVMTSDLKWSGVPFSFAIEVLAMVSVMSTNKSSFDLPVKSIEFSYGVLKFSF